MVITLFQGNCSKKIRDNINHSIITQIVWKHVLILNLQFFHKVDSMTSPASPLNGFYIIRSIDTNFRINGFKPDEISIL